MGQRLGEMKLSEIDYGKPEPIRIVDTSKFMSYVEVNYFGNPGFYKYYLFALLPIPTELETTLELHQQLRKLSTEEDKSIDNEKIAECRSQLVPNTFCIVQGPHSEETDNLLEYLTSIEWLWDTWSDTREF